MVTQIADTQAAIVRAIAAATLGMEAPRDLTVKGGSCLTDSLKKALIDFDVYLNKQVHLSCYFVRLTLVKQLLDQGQEFI